jgi:hypothetical protein
MNVLLSQLIMSLSFQIQCCIKRLSCG